MRKRSNRLAPTSFSGALNTERSVLTRNEIEWTAGIDLDCPEIRSDFAAVCDARAVKLVFGQGHCKVTFLDILTSKSDSRLSGPEVLQQSQSASNSCF